MVVCLGASLILVINLTNTFLAPCLVIIKAKRSSSSDGDGDDDDATVSYCYEKNRVISAIIFGAIAVAVTGVAAVQSVTVVIKKCIKNGVLGPSSFGSW
jgi:hypothetical protein